MCDTIAGELLLSFHKGDPAGAALVDDIRLEKIPHVRIIEDLARRIGRIGLAIRDSIEFRFYRLSVPIGQEAYTINDLQLQYKQAVLRELAKKCKVLRHSDILYRPSHELQVVPHSILSLSGSATGLPNVGFTFTKTHTEYKKLVGWSAPSPTATTKRVLVLDTGLDPCLQLNMVSQKNFLDDGRLEDARDDHGHGTAVTSIIHDLCASAEFLIYKVADRNGRASEWDLLAALAAQNGADLINISLAFGLPKRHCPVCGRESRSSRSAVFESMIHQLANAKDGPILIAAAGNDGENQLSFPARFDALVAVSSVNLALELSRFSNRAAYDQDGEKHNNVFVLPGGETDARSSDPIEYVGKSSGEAKYFGTSFSAAYATGVICALWSQPLYSGGGRHALMHYLRSNAERALPHFNEFTHGNGLMRFR